MQNIFHDMKNLVKVKINILPSTLYLCYTKPNEEETLNHEKTFYITNFIRGGGKQTRLKAHNREIRATWIRETTPASAATGGSNLGLKRGRDRKGAMYLQKAAAVMVQS